MRTNCPIHKIFIHRYGNSPTKLIGLPIPSTQIASLVALNFLTWVSQEGVLDTVKLKCNVTYDFVSVLALNIQVDLGKYLHAT